MTKTKTTMMTNNIFDNKNAKKSIYINHNNYNNQINCDNSENS